ncbi:sigma-70 family RNA polymerase sigma factor [Streptomyces sp. DT24]|uniref:sigma-70 family RNA polymerase sigma factor n=1 Tax=unclassified Streptomyces TaxID=2593676 RepID=UPI003CF802ED
MGEDHETALISAAQAGDRSAKDRLVASYLPLLYNIVGRALNGHPDVDDVVQESVFRMLRALPELREPERFRSWLVAITMNEIRGHWRERRTDAVPVEGLDDSHDAVDPGADFVDLTILRLGLTGQRRQVAEATRWLDEDDQELLSLWWLETAGQLSRAEVAAALELSPEHTAVRVQRMKDRLDTARVVVSALAAQPRCVLLEDMTAKWDGAPSALWRKRIARHARGCTVCSGHGSGLVPAEGLLVGLALVPLAMAFPGRAPQFLSTAAEAAPTPPGGAGRAERRRGETRRRRRNTAVAAATAVAVLGAGGAAVRLYADDESRGETVVTADAPVAGTAPSVTSVTPAPKPSPSTASASPSPTRSASPTPTPKAAESVAPSARPERSPTSAAPEHRPAPPAAPASPASGSRIQQVTGLVNAERAKSGCGPVRGNALLDTAAQRHSADMVARNYFSHTSPDGTDPGDRITAAGYRWSTYGENIAKGQRTPADVMSAWMNSPGHRANILNCSFKEIGVGVQDGGDGPVWTQNFGAAQ